MSKKVKMNIPAPSAVKEEVTSTENQKVEEEITEEVEHEEETEETEEGENTGSSNTEETAKAAELVPPVVGPPANVRAKDFQMYNPYFKLYFNTAEPTLVPYIDSWTKCQIEAGLLEVVE